MLKFATQTLASGGSSLVAPIGGSPRPCGIQVDRVARSAGQADAAQEPSPAAAAGVQQVGVGIAPPAMPRGLQPVVQLDLSWKLCVLDPCAVICLTNR